MSWTAACGPGKAGGLGPAAAYESAMDGLEEQIRQGTLDRPGKRRLGKRVLFLAAALAVLACGFAVAAERMGWLSPVVDDGGSGGNAEDLLRPGRSDRGGESLRSDAGERHHRRPGDLLLGNGPV